MKQCILLIDDDDDDCTLMMENLRHVGVKNPIVLAHDGREAVQLLSQMKDNLPSLIISDLNMPKMSGMEVLKIVRETYNIPMILYTTSCTENVVKTAKEYGAIDCVAKTTTYLDAINFAKRIYNICLSIRDTANAVK
jgi:CheY-like chemotaxis protein